MRRFLAIACVLLALAPTPALAHGGLPVARELVWRGDLVYIPTRYWGVFFGRVGGPFKWICEEAINPYQQRLLTIAGDGTFYATDRTGITVSRDDGCTWGPATGAIAGLSVVRLLPAPDKPARLWAAASSVGSGADAQTAAGLYRTDDQGRTFVAALPLEGRVVTGAALSDDGATLVTAARLRAAPFDARVYTSKDGGATFSDLAVTYVFDGAPAAGLQPIAVDPRDGAVYFALDGGPDQLLLRSSDGGATLTEVLRLPMAIEAVAIDKARDQLLVASSAGLYVGQGSAAPVKSPGLSRAQCASVRPDATYVCAWNWEPDNKAVARSTDGAQRFDKVFQYADTLAPYECPEETPVGRTCPMIWLGYADQLGIDLSTRGDGGAGAPADGGAGSPGGAGGTGSAGAAGAAGSGKPGGCAGAPMTARGGGLLAGLLLFALRARRRRP